MEIEEIIDIIFKKIKRLLEGTEISINQFLRSEYSDESNLSNKNMFNIEKGVYEKAKLENIDKSKYTSQIVGLSFNIPFIIKKNRN